MNISRKKDLEILLSKLKSSPSPKIELEQYTTPLRIAAEMLFLAGFVNNDIYGKRILDMGSGNGCLAIGAKLMGADQVVGVEIDLDNIRIALENAVTVDLKKDEISWINGPIETVAPHFDTVIMNPPFGTRKEHADRDFLEKAIEVADVVYTIHKKSTRKYLLEYIRSMGRRVDAVFQMALDIPHIYNFHNKRKKIIEVDVFRIIKVVDSSEPEARQRLKRGKAL
jgi:predicted RNA methylase